MPQSIESSLLGPVPCGHSGGPVTRREALVRSGGGFAALAYAALYGQTAPAGDTVGPVANPPRGDHPATARNVIFLYMDGGPSQVDTFDPKPRLKAEHGKPFPLRMDATQFDAIGKTLASPWEFSPRGQIGRAHV